ncbi:hypothetical protein GGS24DRAFT_515890 [Hypoxylon argillaceum]|nr:hypothetical protein GGS24DRAFT_515890 [Hypoxylon argillaceum]
MDGHNGPDDEEDVSPDEVYARAVDIYSRRNKTTTLYPGEHYRYLNSFLSRPYAWGGSRLIAAVPSASTSPFCHTIISRYTSHWARETISFDCGEQGLEHFRNSDPQAGRRRLPAWLCGHAVPASDMDRARREASRGDKHSFRNPPRSGIGSSIVREYVILDDKYFAIEKQFSVHVHESKHGSWAAVVICPATIHKTGCRVSARNISRVSILPVLQYQRKMFVGVQHAGPADASSNRDNMANTFQSASLLPFHHGHSLNHDVSRVDALYALSELCRFCAFSESQFINLMSYILKRQRNKPLEELAKTLSNLTYYKRILDSHAERLQVIISCLMVGGGPTWPRATDTEHQAIVEATITVNDTQRGFIQAQHTADLTLLAFYFLPLTLITSFFGMKIKEIQDGNGPKFSLWVFFVIAVPSILLAWAGFRYLRRLGPNRRMAL